MSVSEEPPEAKYFNHSAHYFVADRSFHDNADLNHPQIKGGNAYAWGKLVLDTFRGSLRKAWFETEGSFVIVDACSAYPYLAQMIREEHRYDCEKTTQDIIAVVAEMISPDQTPGKEYPPLFNFIKPRVRHRLSQEMSSPDRRHSRFTSALEASIHQLLYSPMPLINTKIPDLNRMTIKAQFRFNLKDLYAIGHMGFAKSIFDEANKGSISMWRSMGMPEAFLQRPRSQTFDAQARQLLGEADGSEFIDTLVNLMSFLLPPNLKRKRVISLDNKDHREIVSEGDFVFPDEIRNTVLYQRAATFEGSHLRASMLNLPFALNSLSAIISGEGFPYYFKGLPHAAYHELGADIATSIKPRGFLGLLPFAVLDGDTDDESGLKEFVATLRAKDFIVDIVEYSKTVLVNAMGSREKVLVNYSPLFTSPGDYIPVLMGTKTGLISPTG